jgi:uncharacterized protein
VIVVSDTTAITSLLKIDRVNLLRETFGEIHIPEAVRDELLLYHKEISVDFQVHAITNRSDANLLRASIDLGESEAIVLAEELSAHALLIDDKDGRRLAEARGVRCIGLVGALLMAKEAGHIANVKDLLNDLELKANFYLDKKLKISLLKRANELE